jgi:C4-dicarboxylate-specific signal transduction histidine kinase
MTIDQLIIILLGVAIGGGLVIGIATLISKIKDEIEEREERERRVAMATLRYGSLGHQDWEQRRRTQELNLADVEDSGRVGECDVCGLVRNVQKCHVADKTMKLCNDCLYKNKEEREKEIREREKRGNEEMENSLTANMMRITYESGYQ